MEGGVIGSIVGPIVAAVVAAVVTVVILASKKGQGKKDIPDDKGEDK